MQLIGMLDSPYVRRVAISLQLLGLDFEHRPVSVFSTFAQFQAINPVVKAPSLVCDDGTVLMDSTLILDYAEALAARTTGKSLMPADLDARLQALRTIGLALAACEKSVQIVYEHMLRPADKLHPPWLQRITGQLLAAYGALETGLATHPLASSSQRLGQDGVSVGIAWTFTQMMLPGVVPPEHHPALAAFSARAEQLPEFSAAPHSDQTWRKKT